MGTNFYLMTKSKELANKYFPCETTYNLCDYGYEIVDEPYLGYQIHICKRSYGWRPLFQRHNHAFTTFKELEEFYMNHKNELEIYDEYDEKYSFEDFKEAMINHSKREPIPMKWVYEISEFTRHMYDAFHDRELKPTLDTVECPPEEAELWIPFNHVEYAETEVKARAKFGVPLPYWISIDPHEETQYWNDPNYDFDWTIGDFS